MKRLLIAGVGSHNPGDTLGWQALRGLRKRGLNVPGYRIDWLHIQHPALDLMPALQDRADALVVLDAMRHGDGTGIQVLSLQQLQSQIERASSHGFSVADTLNLARQLDQLPPRVLILGLQGNPIDTGRLAHLIRDLAGA